MPRIHGLEENIGRRTWCNAQRVHNRRFDSTADHLAENVKFKKPY